MNFEKALAQLQEGKRVTCPDCDVILYLQPNVVPLLINGSWQISRFILVAQTKEGRPSYHVNAPWSFTSEQQKSTDWKVVK